MSKIAQYLNEHLLGEVSTLSTLRDTYRHDGSVLAITPELVVYPKVTNDIRKVARFSWQLAEKGHVLGVTVRGKGGDPTGGALSSNMVVDTTKYLTEVLFVAVRDKHKVVHVQPGVSLRSLQQTLRWNSLTIGGYKDVARDMTVGGAIASGFVGPAASKYGTVAGAVERMEVVLANGDLIETTRLNKRDVNRKRGQQTFEGEIYRQLDGLIEDNQELIASLSSECDNIGYRIDQVKQKDGSIDLTPLFIGSQGTLGIISEVVLKADFYSGDEAVVVAACESSEEARDIADAIARSTPATLRVIDGAFVAAAHERGKQFLFDKEGKATIGALVYASFDDFSRRQRERSVKQVLKRITAKGGVGYSSLSTALDDLYAVRDIEQAVALPLRADEVAVPVCSGAYVPRERHEEFLTQLAALGTKYHVTLPVVIDVLSGIITTAPLLHLQRVGDRQKLFKLVVEYAATVHAVGGTVAGQTAEGRLNAYAAYGQLEEPVRELYEKVRRIFDPFGTLNPGVKQSTELKTLVRQLRD